RRGTNIPGVRSARHLDARSDTDPGSWARSNPEACSGAVCLTCARRSSDRPIRRSPAPSAVACHRQPADDTNDAVAAHGGTASCFPQVVTDTEAERVLATHSVLN